MKKQNRHYDAGGVASKDILRAKLTPEQLVGFYLGNVIKYATRANHKGCFESDIAKMAEYAQWLAELVDEVEPDGQEGYCEQIEFVDIPEDEPDEGEASRRTVRDATIDAVTNSLVSGDEEMVRTLQDIRNTIGR